jgi:hypothetical protein
MAARVGGTEVVLKQQTDYPRDGRIVMEVTPQKELKFPLKLRIPAWSVRTRVDVPRFGTSLIGGSVHWGGIADRYLRCPAFGKENRHSGEPDTWVTAPSAYPCCEESGGEESKEVTYNDRMSPSRLPPTLNSGASLPDLGRAKKREKPRFRGESAASCSGRSAYSCQPSSCQSRCGKK